MQELFHLEDASIRGEEVTLPVKVIGAVGLELDRSRLPIRLLVVVVQCAMLRVKQMISELGKKLKSAENIGESAQVGPLLG